MPPCELQWQNYKFSPLPSPQVQSLNPSKMLSYPTNTISDHRTNLSRAIIYYCRPINTTVGRAFKYYLWSSTPLQVELQSFLCVTLLEGTALAPTPRGCAGLAGGWREGNTPRCGPKIYEWPTEGRPLCPRILCRRP
jgi:hypothetical protein